MTSRVVTSWIDELGTCVVSRALEMTVAMATNDSVDSLPPWTHQRVRIGRGGLYPSVSQHCPT